MKCVVVFSGASAEKLYMAESQAPSPPPKKKKKRLLADTQMHK